MQKIMLFVVMGLLCLSFSIIQQISPQLSPSQTAVSEEIKPLKIGQKIPASIYQQTMTIMLSKGNKLDSTSLSQYQGKFILLDFWATWCGSCINKFPKLDTLQQKYQDEVVILLVNTKSTKDNLASMKGILNGSRAPYLSSDLPNIYGDTLLNKLFPHPYLPHYVWIGKKGELKAVSDASILNENTIKAILTEAKLTEIKTKP